MKIKVILMMAQSVDGIIAKHPNHFPDWTCREDKRLFKKVTTDAGVLIMGARTYTTIGKPLAGRNNIVYTNHPGRYPGAENVTFTSKKPSDLLSDLALQGYEQVILTGGPTINSLFARERAIDEVLLTVSPKVFGAGLTLFSEPIDLNLDLLEFSKLDAHTLLFHYRVQSFG
jgi:dihydrofolate reductase